jgi:hypothetical protein
MADRAGIRVANDFVPFGRLQDLLVQQEAWQNEVERLEGGETRDTPQDK